jgi:hypothetical protein
VVKAMVAICSLLQIAGQLASPAHRRKALPEPFKRAEKTGLTRAAKIAAEWQNAKLRHLAHLMRGLWRKIIRRQVTLQES